MAERVIADHKVTCSNQVTSFRDIGLFLAFWFLLTVDFAQYKSKHNIINGFKLFFIL